MNIDSLGLPIYQFLQFGVTGLLHLTWWQVLIYTLIATHITIAAVTIYLHRCQAHRALDLHPIVSHFFRAWLWLSTGMVTKEWAAIHRKHHAKCETDEDPHSPVAYGIKKVLLEGTELYRAEAKNEETLAKYGHGTPDDWIERNLYTKYSMFGVYVTLVVNLLLFGFLGLAVFAVQMMWIPITAAGIINGIGHWAGYRNFDAPDASRNIVPWGILIGGEELHNNHHAFGTSAKLSNRWYEFDIGWMYITILKTFGLATVHKVAPTPKLVSARSTVDFDALQGVIHHRYDMMAAYAKSIRREVKGLQLSGLQMSSLARKWLHVDRVYWPEAHQAKLSAYIDNNESLQKLILMRNELSAIWARSSASREQLLSQLQSWCQRAEDSDIKSLQELALRARSYAV